MYERNDFSNENIYSNTSNSCPTCIGANEEGNAVIVGYSDDSLIMYDIRSKYQQKIRLESAGKSCTVRSIVFSPLDGDFLFLSGDSNSKLKLWNLRY